MPEKERSYPAYLSVNTFLDTYTAVAREYMSDHAGWDLDAPQHPEDISVFLSTVLEVMALTLGHPQVRTYPRDVS